MDKWNFTIEILATELPHFPKQTQRNGKTWSKIWYCSVSTDASGEEKAILIFFFFFRKSNMLDFTLATRAQTVSAAASLMLPIEENADITERIPLAHWRSHHPVTPRTHTLLYQYSAAQTAPMTFLLCEVPSASQKNMQIFFFFIGRVFFVLPWFHFVVWTLWLLITATTVTT